MVLHIGDTYKLSGHIEGCGITQIRVILGKTTRYCVYSKTARRWSKFVCKGKYDQESNIFKYHLSYSGFLLSTYSDFPPRARQARPGLIAALIAPSPRALLFSLPITADRAGNFPEGAI